MFGSLTDDVDLVKLSSTRMEFLRELWRKQPDGYFCLTYRPLDGGTRAPFIDMWFRKKDGYLSGAMKEPQFSSDGEWYFCPTAFSSMERTKEAALPSRWLFADLDWVPPHEVPMTPTFSWETSPGKWQAVWLTAQVIEPGEFDSLNKALNRVCGADAGTWNRNRLLRVPGTAHLKAERKKMDEGARV